MEKFDFGLYQIINVCLQLKKGEKLTFVTDKLTQDIAPSLLNEAQKILGKDNIFYFEMEDFGERSEDGSNPLKFPKEIFDAMQKSDASLLLTQCLPGEVGSFRSPMIKAASKIRHAHMPGITKELIETGMAIDYNVIREISKKVFDIVHAAKEIRVISRAGTDFTATFDAGIKWLIDDGDFIKNTFGNLPAGEVFTSPKSLNGIAVIDGVLGDTFGDLGTLEKNPLILTIKDSRVIEVKCENQNIKSAFEEYIKSDENADRIGEFAIGTNIGLKSFCGNLLQDEKFPGVHIAVGDSYSSQTGTDWTSNVHCDGIMTNVDVYVDGVQIMKNSEFLI